MSKRESAAEGRTARLPGPGSAPGDAERPSGAATASTLGVVTALMEERRRFESWLASLAARREATPPRVFERVHADYTTRLQDVVTQLIAHGEELRAELDRLTGRLESAYEQQQQARDERAEAELRAHVGELSAAEWDETARAADERIDGLVGRHADLETELLRTRELLAEAERPATPHLGSATVAAGAARDDSVEASVTASVDAAAATATPASVPALSDVAEGSLHVPGGAAAAPTSGTPARDGHGLPNELTPAVLAAEATLFDTPSTDAPSTDAPSTDAPSTDAPSTDAPAAEARPAGSFDELAFLSSVVDTPVRKETVAPVRRPAPPPAKEAPIENRDATADTSILGRSSRQGTPMAANISGNNPIVLKDKSLDGAKTLKCADCGSMNYPTEWYCEKCGAELASL